MYIFVLQTNFYTYRLHLQVLVFITLSTDLKRFLAEELLTD